MVFDVDDALLAEPYKVAQLKVTNALAACLYSWEITGKYLNGISGSLHKSDYFVVLVNIIDKDNLVVDSGESETGSFETSELKIVGQYSLAVTESCGDDSSRTTKQSVGGKACVYVCRVWCACYVYVESFVR